VLGGTRSEACFLFFRLLLSTYNTSGSDADGDTIECVAGGEGILCRLWNLSMCNQFVQGCHRF